MALNTAQQEAVMAPPGPALVLAGAGTGKTRVLTERIIARLGQGLDPRTLLVLTFTNKAAKEMRGRIEARATADGLTLSGAFLGTFHGWGARLLRRHIHILGRSRDFTILDSDDSRKELKRILKEMNLSEDEDAGYLASLISSWKNDLQTPEDLWAVPPQNDPMRMQALQVYERYRNRLIEIEAVDFDDLLLLPILLLESTPALLARYQKACGTILVDEYQDTNRAQYRLLHMLAGEHHDITVVGDDDQAIYTFRGADVRNIRTFLQDFKPVKVIRLQENYRSTGKILSVANGLIERNTARLGKVLMPTAGDGEKVASVTLPDDETEARWIAERIQAAAAALRPYADFGILYRTNAQSRTLEAALRDRGIPYRIAGGVRFFDRREVRDVMAYLRCIANPMDSMAIERALQWPKRGVGDTTAERIASNALAGEGAPALSAAAKDVPRMRQAAHRSLEQWDQSYAGWRALAASGSVVDVLTSVLADIDARDALLKERDVGHDRWDNVQELVNAAAAFDPSQYRDGDDDDRNELTLFVQHVALLSDVDQMDVDADAVTMMTIHAAKGLEFPEVVVAGLEEGLLPHARSRSPEEIEEERRLLYVALTRAERRLSVTHARRRRQGGQYGNTTPSRFLQELPVEGIHEITMPDPRVPQGARRPGYGWSQRTRHDSWR